MLPDSAARSEARGLLPVGFSDLDDRSGSTSPQPWLDTEESIRGQPAHRGFVKRFDAFLVVQFPSLEV